VARATECDLVRPTPDLQVRKEFHRHARSPEVTQKIFSKNACHHRAAGHSARASAAARHETRRFPAAVKVASAVSNEIVWDRIVRFVSQLPWILRNARSGER